MDTEKKELLKSIIKKDSPTILDIGANNGKDTVFFLKNFSNSLVYSFEPDERALKDFVKRSKKHKKYYDRNKLFPYAISDKDSFSSFYMTTSSGSSSLRKPLLSPSFPLDSSKIEKIVRVKTKKLDTWCEENKIGEIDCIWSDIQGGEDMMIRGGMKSLERTKVLILECILFEAYEGLWSKQKILKLLPNFKIIKDFKGSNQSDIFLKNINY